MMSTTNLTAAYALLIILTLAVGALICAIAIIVQRAIIKRNLWTVAIVVAIIEIVFLRIPGVITIIYTAFKWDKAKKAKQEENKTPPEV